jgi:hypothetical protein
MMVDGRKRRPRWICRVLGHRFRDPFFDREIHFYLPSAEGAMGLPDPQRRLIGMCRCGEEWRADA